MNLQQMTRITRRKAIKTQLENLKQEEYDLKVADLAASFGLTKQQVIDALNEEESNRLKTIILIAMVGFFLICLLLIKIFG